MRILSYSEYISIDDDPCFSRNITGYGYAVIDIATSLSNIGVKVDLITFSGITRQKSIGKVNILCRTYLDIISNIRFIDIVNGIKYVASNGNDLYEKFRIILSYSSMGFFLKSVNNENYDVVHFHGITAINFPLMKLCIKNNIKFVVTLHGLNSFDSNASLSKNELDVERLFLKMTQLQNVPVTVISQGIRKDILNFLGKNKINNFTVINNGCEFNNHGSKSVEIRKVYNIKKDSKVALCVGNFSENKNQIQVVRAYAELPKSIQEKLTILFLGNNEGDKRVEQLISNLNLGGRLIVCGHIRKSEINYYYASADFTILASLREGFGLSIIEGFFFGLPSLIFDDLSVFNDIYTSKAVLALSSRSDNDLRAGIIKMVNLEWDNKYIKLYSNKFSLSSMASRYNSFYKGLS